jgi:hypothetical protein
MRLAGHFRGSGCAGPEPFVALFESFTKQEIGSSMNTANLQMQGLLAVVSSLLQVMEQKGVLSRQDIETALARAEADATRGFQHGSLSEANVDAICFPARYLHAAQSSGTATFEEIARAVGQDKDRLGGLGGA